MDRSTEDAICLGIVGLGKMGVMHATMASQCPGAKVAALIDKDSKLAANVQSMGLAAQTHASLGAAIEADSIHAVSIAAPSFTHRALAEQALNSGLHVLCEKPIAHNLEDARRMVDAAATHPDQIAAVAFMKGHIGLFRDTARLLHEGALGEVRRFSASVYLSQVFSPKSGWTFTKGQSGGGVLINTGIHLIHLVSLLFGRVTALYCKARPMHSSVEDTLTAIMEFENGCFGSIDMSWSVPGYETEVTRIRIEGANGVIDLDDTHRRTHLLSPWNQLPKGLSVAHQSQFDRAPFSLTPDYCGEGYCNEMIDFIAAIRDKRPPLYTFEDGYQIQRIVDGLYRSAEGEGRVVFDSPAGLVAK